MKLLLLLSLSFFMFSCASSKNAKVDDAAKVEAKTEAAAKKTAAKVVANTKEKAECVTGKDRREVSLVNSADGGCEVHYLKFGDSRVAASAKNDQKHCESIYERIKANLETAGFVCK